jgi:hypothetical protein
MGPNPQQPRFSPLQRATSLETILVEFHPVPFEQDSNLFFVSQLAMMRFLVSRNGKTPSPALLRRAPSPQGRGLSFPVRVGVRKTALSLGERVARCRRFHQPERAG